jgi:multiple sugar transport system substrate-binding protein
MKHTFKLFAIMLLVMSLVLAGCAKDNSASNAGSANTPSNGGSSDKSADSGNEKSSGKATDILFWSGFSGPDGPFMKKIVDAYNSSQDQYKVKFVIHPHGEYYKQIDVAISTNKNRPDVMIMHLDQIPTYVNKGQLYAIDDIAATAGFSKVDYIQAAVDYATIDGKWYGIPLDIHPMLMYYNKDLFKAAGVDKAPTNRDEFMTALEKLTDKSKGQYGYVVPTLWPQQMVFPSFVFQNGGSLATDKGEIAYNSPEAVEMLEFFRGLIDKGFSPDNVQQDGENTLFLQGKNAIQFNGPWMKGQFDEAGLNYGAAPLPQLGNVKQAVFAGSHTFVVPKGVEDKNVLAGVGDFLKYVANNSMDWVESGQAVASTAVLESDAFKKLEMQMAVRSEFDYVQFAPKIINWGAIVDPLWGEVNLALLGKKSAKQALDDAATKSNQALKANK